jgi:hypothetical protein
MSSQPCSRTGGVQQCDGSTQVSLLMQTLHHSCSYLPPASACPHARLHLPCLDCQIAAPSSPLPTPAHDTGLALRRCKRRTIVPQQLVLCAQRLIPARVLATARATLCKPNLVHNAKKQTPRGWEPQFPHMVMSHGQSRFDFVGQLGLLATATNECVAGSLRSLLVPM